MENTGFYSQTFSLQNFREITLSLKIVYSKLISRNIHQTRAQEKKIYSQGHLKIFREID